VAARHDPSRARRVACLGIGAAPGGPLVLLDATPDLPSQAEELRGASGIEPAAGRPVDAICLTHAHAGHYAGLVHLGREAMAARAVPLHATIRMGLFLKTNRPWSRLLDWGHAEVRTFVPGIAVDLGGGVRIEPLRVPHRDEDSDTVGFVVAGPSRRLLYVPDTDAWGRWRPPVTELVEGVDVALLDGTFFDAGEVPGRDPEAIPHPTIRSSMDLLAAQAASGRVRILFTHLNHTNPALDPRSEASREIRRRGFAVASEGMEFAL
jgi:pyrroloquinoline quinone biosynthesis protein B